MNPLLSLHKPIGFGFMKASWKGSPVLDDPTARQAFIDVLKYALDQGVTFFDTADIYAATWDTVGHNEKLLAEALGQWEADPSRKSKLVIATKGGITRAKGEVWGRNASADYLVRAAERSALNLGLAVIPVWQHHRLDPSRTLAEALQGLLAVKNSGLCKNIGVSNYSSSQVRAAYDILGGPADGGLVSVQNQLNPSYLHELDVLQTCEELELAYLPWSPMAGARETEAGTPSYSALTDLANLRGVSRFAVASSWLRGLSTNLVVMPGVTRRESVEDSLTALDFELTAQEHSQLQSQLTSRPVDAEIVSDQPREG